jgi:hypothetical protein
VRVKGSFRSTVVACLLAGVVLVSSGFAVVSGAKVAKPGGVCGKAGARVVSQSVSLVCKKKVSGKLVWRVVKASTTSTTTTTTVASIKNSAPKVAVVAPRVVSASAVTGNAVITIADMSPDTGVYALQWVLQGSTFNTYQMVRATSPSMSVPAGWFACNRTYTFRVFMMQADWQLADGHQTQNVTPHSTPFDVVMPACSATTPAAPLTCATGGTCIVGDTGPGGGIVFYVHDDADDLFTSTGSDCDTTCKYLEAALTDQSTGIVWATTAAFCYNSGSTTDTNSCQANSVYSGDSTAQSTSRTAATPIGMGMANTNQIYARVSNGGALTSAYAAGIAWAYDNNSKTDWHLPSKDELNELCKYARTQTTGDTAVICANTGTIRSGFSTATYWSSSESDLFVAWYQNFFTGGQSNYNYKYNTYRVRPVRAFG